jgi:ubiquinone/menaquinone biosynthesis C-methylase UbiE
VLRQRQAVERALLAACNATTVDLPSAEILDVGTGGGSFLSMFIGLGAMPARCHGIDLVPSRIEIARERVPVDLRVADATALPYPAAQFDLVSQFTCLCNIVDDELRQRAADEMVRVLRPGGRLVWFDLAWTKPTEITRPISEPAVLFPSLERLWSRKLVSRPAALVRNRPRLAAVFDALPVLRANRLDVFG